MFFFLAVASQLVKALHEIVTNNHLDRIVIMAEVVLRVCEVKAENLPNIEKKSKSDPYASLEFKGELEILP